MLTRTFLTYQQALTVCFTEEVAGVTYFSALADRESGPARAALALISRIETEIVTLIAPLMQRNGFSHPPLNDLYAEGRADAAAAPDWPDLLRAMAEDYDAYMPEFQQTIALAPPQDHPALQRLMDHELALIAYGRAEWGGQADPMAALRDFLAGSAGHPG